MLVDVAPRQLLERPARALGPALRDGVAPLGHPEHHAGGEPAGVGEADGAHGADVMPAGRAPARVDALPRLVAGPLDHEGEAALVRVPDAEGAVLRLDLLREQPVSLRLKGAAPARRLVSVGASRTNLKITLGP